MKILSTLLCAGVCLLCMPFTAHALDPGAAVKATQVLKTTTSWNGEPIVYPQGTAEVTGLVVEIAPGGETGWHLHPVPSFALMLQGTLEVRTRDGRVKRVHAGDAFAEVRNTWHNGRNVGTVPVKLVVFYAGAVGKPVSVKEGDAAAAR